LPARPEIPSLNGIHEDIANASEDDSVFKLTLHNGGNISSQMSASSKPVAENVRNEMSKIELSSDEAYNQVKTFVEANGSIKQSLAVIENLSKQLEEAGFKLNQQMTTVQQHVHNTDS